MIEDMEGVTRELLMQFYRNVNQQKPCKIVMYRDGVSEGQFQQVCAIDCFELKYGKLLLLNAGAVNSRLPKKFISFKAKVFLFWSFTFPESFVVVVVVVVVF